MLWAWIVGGVIALSVLTLNVGATIAILRSRTLPPSRKATSLATAWILPVAGALLVLHSLQEHEPETIPRELVAASGLGWGVIMGSRKGEPGRGCGRGNGSGDHGTGDGGG